MAIIIGFGTVATIDGHCVVSASWNSNPNSQRMWCLDGSFTTPALIIQKPTQTASLSIYSPGTATDVSASEGCDTPTSVSNNTVNIVPSSCQGDDIDGISSQAMMVTSYSYSKEDITLPGQESWSLQLYITEGVNVKAPSHIIRGAAEGTCTDTTVCGITIADPDFTSTAGNVSAGGVGRADTMIGGIVSSVGGGEGSTGTNTGQGSVSIPYTPMWLEAV